MTQYVHPSSKQCSWTPDLSNINAKFLDGSTKQQIIDNVKTGSIQWTTLYDNVISLSVQNNMSNSEYMITTQNDLPADFTEAFKSKTVNSMITVVTYSNLNCAFTLHRDWDSRGSLGFATKDSYNYTFKWTTLIGDDENYIHQNVPYTASMTGLLYSRTFFLEELNRTPDSSVSTYFPMIGCSVRSNSADKRFSISGTLRAKIQSIQY